MAEYVRCIFCLSGQEEHIRKRIEERQLGQVIIPMKEKPFRKNGEWTSYAERMMPGYLFVYHPCEIAWTELKKVDGVIRILTYSNDPDDSYLRGSDLEFAGWLLNKNGIAAKLEAIKEGDFVTITDPLFLQMQGRVIDINKRRHMVNVELMFMGAVRNVWLGYEVVEKSG